MLAFSALMIAGFSAAQGPSSGGEADISVLDNTCVAGEQSEGIENIDSSGGTVTWTGYIQTPNPCYGANLTDVVETGENSYQVSIDTNEGEEACQQCLGMLTYEAEFSAENDFELEVLHDGEQVDTITSEGDAGSDDSTGVNPLVSLNEGWSLISVPQRMSLEEFEVCEFREFEGSYAYHYVGHSSDKDWEGYDIDEELDPMKGYYAYLENDCDLSSLEDGYEGDTTSKSNSVIGSIVQSVKNFLG